MHNIDSNQNVYHKLELVQKTNNRNPNFGKCMSRRRFLKITKYLHFYNDGIIKSRETLDKLAPIVKFFNDKFKELYVLEEHISIDESLMKFKGRMKHKVFNPSKRARFGIKFYKLCESASGYCHSLKYMQETATII
jgi:hypothetical protein